jgi:F0F1-type ATP synthase membrane subunit b/b'
MSTGLIIAIVIVALIVIALIYVASSRSQARKRDERREVAGHHRDEARLRHAKADKHQAEADEKAARAKREAAEAEERAHAARREREAAEAHHEHAAEVDPDGDAERSARHDPRTSETEERRV